VSILFNVIFRIYCDIILNALKIDEFCKECFLMKKIGIIGAMATEVEDLLKFMSPYPGEDSVRRTQSAGLLFHEGMLENSSVVVVRSGVGKVNAALCTQRLITMFGVTHVINTGIAGALAHGLGILDFVVSTDAMYHDVDATGFGYKQGQIPQMETWIFPADAGMVTAAETAFAGMKESKSHKIIAGRIASGDQFIASAGARTRIRKICGDPACVEMEGAAIAHTCFLNGIPYLVIRCMSDMADEGEEATSVFNENSAADMSSALVRAIIPLL
jgi:adenosylhomocysteine nucleosidase